ncbi:MAG: DUF465 domain-containing protein [Nitrospirae bacterium]|nr:MAG: DUF465 domain-containing protein [Nitrospirota bacterium]
MKEQEIREVLRAENPEFQQLEAEHRALESRLSELEGKPFLTSEEEIEIKQIKKQKLAKKDKMAMMIREYKKMVLQN